MEKVRNNEVWVRCPKCGHKLFKAIEPRIINGVEIKCHSCKNIILIAPDGGNGKEEGK